MKKNSIYLALTGVILVVGLIVIFSINNNDDNNSAQSGQSGETPEAKETFNQEAVEVVANEDGTLNANNLFIPWTINKSGDSFFLSQREGSVIQIDGIGLVQVQDVEVTKEILHEGEGGFLGFTLDPNYDSNDKAYAYHTYEEDGKALNRIVSLKLKDGTWKEEDVLLEGIPGGEINNGGRILIGEDGMLYATTGDTGTPTVAQDQENLAGKILRMELDGNVPTDNPLEDSFVYSYGHRNPQGLAWDDEGNLYSSEHGEDGHDEINLIEAGKNYGWPVIQGDQEATGMVAPIAHSGDETWAPSGMAFHDGKLFIASLAGRQIFTYDIASEEVAKFYDEAGRLRDVVVDGDSLFMITNNHDQRGTPGDKDDRLIEVSLTDKENATES